MITFTFVEHIVPYINLIYA